MNNEPKRRAPRRAAPVKKVSKRPPAYTGPSWAAIQRLTDEEVITAFKELGVEQDAFAWDDEDNQLNVSRWADYPIALNNDEPKRTPPHDQITNKKALAELKATAWTIYQEWQRPALLRVYIQRWIETLEDAQLIAEIESVSEESFSESERRYCKREDLRDRLSHLVWPIIHQQPKEDQQQ